MSSNKLHALLAGAALSAGLCAPAQAQTLADQIQFADASTVIVLGRRLPPSQEAAAEALADVPGGVDLVPFESFEKRYAVSFADTLRLSPGVIADPRFAEEVRLSIRGSGLSRGFHMRGIDLSLDGVPINLADGAGDFQEIDPLSAQRIEVYRGANGLIFGSASLGGAVNLATPTGRDVDAPLSVRVEGGSFGTFRQNVRFGVADERRDLFGAITHNESEGFRDHDDGESTRISLNGGVKWRAGETRFTLNLNEINQHLPGSLTLAQALADPEMAAVAAVSGDQARDIRSARASLRHSAEVEGVRFETGLWAFDKSLYHPIFQVINQDSLDWGAFARLSDTNDAVLVRRWTLGLSYARGDNDAEQYINVGGAQGGLTQDADQVAQTIKLYGEVELGLSDALSLILGAQAITSDRDYARSFPSIVAGSERFDAINPKLGFLWSASEDVTVYGNISRSFEPPTFSEFVQTPFGSFVSVIQPVDAQSAWTAEIGARGEAGPFVFDVALYRANVEDEMLQYSSGVPGVLAATFNAEDTIHQGLEAFVQWHALDTGAGDLTAAIAYTFSDFKFDDDAQYGDNRLAGAARHQVHAEASWRAAGGWYVTPNVNWIPEDVDVDYANTTKAPGYTVWGLSAGFDLGPASFFIEGRNLTDETYIATFSTATTANAGSALYYPGETRSVYAGVTYRFGGK